MAHTQHTHTAYILLHTTQVAPWTGRFWTLLDPTYAKKFIPIIASVAEHQPTTWASYFFDTHFSVCCFDTHFLVWGCVLWVVSVYCGGFHVPFIYTCSTCPVFVCCTATYSHTHIPTYPHTPFVYTLFPPYPICIHPTRPIPHPYTPHL